MGTKEADGHPLNRSNRLVLIGVFDGSTYTPYFVEYEDLPYGNTLDAVRDRLQGASLLINHNIKYDLHWLKRYIPDMSFGDVYCTQLGEFLLTNQTNVFPSLDGVAESRALGRKGDIVRRDYWDVGINTDAVPREILTEYNEQDCRLAWSIAMQQMRELEGKKQLCVLQMRDLLLLQEMEFNGLYYNTAKACAESEKAQARLAAIDSDLRSLMPEPCINWGSDDHLSAVLYGGVIYERYREKYTREFKSGPAERERWGVRAVKFKRLTRPIKDSETKPTSDYSDGDLEVLNKQREVEGKTPFSRHWSVAEPILRRLKPTKKGQRLIELLLEKARLDKLDSTYYSGMVKFLDDKEWGEDCIHGQFNQCVARTGRLSSSKPNLQNFAGSVKELVYSRYDD